MIKLYNNALTTNKSFASSKEGWHMIGDVAWNEGLLCGLVVRQDTKSVQRTNIGTENLNQNWFQHSLLVLDTGCLGQDPLVPRTDPQLVWEISLANIVNIQLQFWYVHQGHKFTVNSVIKYPSVGQKFKA